MKYLLPLIAIMGFNSIVAQFTTNCNQVVLDTVRYIDSKTSAYTGIYMNDINDGGSYGYAGFAEKFEAPDSLRLKGACFYAVMDTDPTDSIFLRMYDANGTGGPGTELTSVKTEVLSLGAASYTGPMNSQIIKVCGEFPSPITWEGDYFLSLENFASTDVAVARNLDGDGAGESNSWTYYKGQSDPSFDGWYEMLPFGVGWDFDVIIRPLVEFDLSTSIILDTNNLCLGDTLNVSSSWVVDDSILYNKFYNPNFASYNGGFLIDSINYGEGNGNTISMSNEYAAGGAYEISHLQYINSGWTMSSEELICNANDSVNVIDVSIDLGADEGLCAQDTLILSVFDLYDTYLWSDLSTDTAYVISGSMLMNGANDVYLDVTLNGCSARDSIVVNVNDSDPDLGNDTILCLNQTLVLDAGVYDSYDWNTSHTTQVVTFGPFSGPDSNLIVVNVVDGSCSGSDSILVVVDDCLGAEVHSMDVKVYPNPASTQLNINLTEGTSTEYAVTDLSGKMVITGMLVDGPNTINIENLSNGNYLLNLVGEHNVISRKISILK